MKIAVDVKGTLEGYKKPQILRMIELFQKAGHTVVVWSNLYSYAVDAVRDNNLQNIESTSKSGKGDYGFEGDESKFYDLAIEDDHSQTWLAAKRFIFVDEIPNTVEQIEEFMKAYL